MRLRKGMKKGGVEVQSEHGKERKNAYWSGASQDSSFKCLNNPMCAPFVPMTL